MLGNLTIDEMERRAGVSFPPELKAYMEDKHQPEASKVHPGKWHCFDIPFTLVCGDMAVAMKIYEYLRPMSAEFKEQMNIAVNGLNETGKGE